MTDVAASKAATAAAFEDPQPGDRYTEFWAFWVIVVARDGDCVTTLEASAPCTFPEDGERWEGTVAEFKARFAYGSIPGYWVRLVDRGRDVTGWAEAGRAR